MHVFIKFYFGFKYLIDFEILHYQFNQFIINFTKLYQTLKQNLFLETTKDLVLETDLPHILKM